MTPAARVQTTIELLIKCPGKSTDRMGPQEPVCWFERPRGNPVVFL